MSATPIADDVHEAVSTRCIEAAVDGLRADLVMVRAARALAALESATVATSAHVECVADLVLRHRRHDPGHGGNDAPRGVAQADKATRNETPKRGRQHPSDGYDDHGRDGLDDSRRDDPDWGYLPPEPTGIVNVKGVIPLSTKKR